MSKPCLTVTPDMTVEECSRVLEENKIRRVPVVDSAGSCCGIVALADLALCAREEVAQVVKEVSSNHCIGRDRNVIVIGRFESLLAIWGVAAVLRAVRLGLTALLSRFLRLPLLPAHRTKFG